MLYKDYEITAEVQSYDVWTINEDGSLDDWREPLDGVEITGYFFKNEKTGDEFHQSVSESDAETLKALVDDHIKELA